MAFFEAINMTIKFGGLTALNNVSFEISKNEIFSIIGPNGAGKTTIFNCISRFYDLNQGTIVFKEKDITRKKPHTIADYGIARTFQNIELFSNMTVMDNIILGRHRQRKANIFSELFFLPSVRRQEIEHRKQAELIIGFLELEAYRDELITSLPYGLQKRVELGRALSLEPDLLLLDEPSSGLSLEETEELAYWIREIREGMQISIALVEHSIRLVKSVSDHVIALDFGEIITQGDPEAVLSHPDVVKAYLGEEDAAIEDK